MRRSASYTTSAHRLAAYGLTDAEYRAMAQRQRGACPICGDKPAMLVVDHHHESGAIRGLLCDRCNRALGHLKDSPGVCDRAAEYLRGFARSSDRANQ